jgi:hypothetical protein
VRSASCSPTTTPKQAGAGMAHTAWPAAERRPASTSSTRTVQRAQSACCGTARGGSPAANPRQGVHRKLPQPTVHSPNTVESPSSKRGRQATEGWNSPARSTELELNGGEGVTFLVREAAPKLKEAPGPVYGEKWLGTDGAAENRGGCGGDGSPEADTTRVRMRCRGGLRKEATHACARRERGR